MHKLDTLDNKLRVATFDMGHMESVSLGIWIRSGSRYEDTKNNGISHLLEHLLFKGTNKRDMKEIKEEIEGRGGSFNGFTSEEYTCYLVKVLSKDIELGVDILSDMVFNPKLDESEVLKEKDVIIEEINMYKDIPAQHVHEILAEMMWPDQPIGMPLAGTVESVRSLKRSDILSYKEKFYVPQSMLLIGVGRIAQGYLSDLSKKYFSKYPVKETHSFEGSRVEQDEHSLKVNFKETEQTHIALGFHSTPRFHPDRYALSIMNIILGANMSSRLFHIARDEMALCYEISSSVRRYEDTGAFVVGAGVDNKKVIKFLEVILRELARIKKEPVSADELKRAKEYYKGQLLFALEDTMSHMLWLGERIVTGAKEYVIKNILDNADKVKPDDIMRVAQNIFNTKNLNLAVIGPVKDDKGLEGILNIR